MSVLTVAGVGRTLGSTPRSLLASAVEHLHDAALVANPAIDVPLEVLLDRLCLSLAVAKPVGLATWAEREGKRFGPAPAAELAGAACHAIAGAARQYEVDHGRLLATLEILKTEIDRALAPMRQLPAPVSPQLTAEGADALLAMLGERDRATCSHSRATGEWTRRLAESMGFDSDASTFIELCAVLHDIGKIGTPDAVLFKPGPLTDDEWSIMREHAAAGERILEQIPSLARCAPIVRAHHERYDGAGYPDRRAGSDIPIEARIVAVADAFHAMISDRPYRRAIAPRAALTILADGRGTQWDPDAVDAMLGLFKRTTKSTSEQKFSTA
jgi:putative nucleotidyltransferase with HDIG domain